MASLTTLLVAYDITDDNRRARVSAALSQTGLRFQYSLFTCQVAEPNTSEFIEKLTALIDPDRDRLFVMPICATCHAATKIIGPTTVQLEQLMWII